MLNNLRQILVTAIISLGISTMVYFWVLTSWRTETNFTNNLILLIDIAAFVLIFAFLYPQVRFKFLKQEAAKIERGELLTDPAKAPQIVRLLTKEETETLKTEHKIYYEVVNNGVKYLVGMITVGIFAFSLLYLTSGFVYSSVFVILLMLWTLAMSLAFAISEGRVYLDLRTPVFQVAGKAKVGKMQLENTLSYSLEVRGIVFDQQTNPDFVNEFSRLRDGEQVVVEYSPNIKRIWKLQKLENV